MQRVMGTFAITWYLFMPLSITFLDFDNFSSETTMSSSTEISDFVWVWQKPWPPWPILVSNLLKMKKKNAD